MKTETRKHVSLSDRFHIGKIIEANISSDGEEDGTRYVKYNDGWDDERVVAVAQTNIHTVRRIRQELFGKIRKGQGENFFRATIARVEALERRVAELEEAATKPRMVKSFADLPVNGSRS